MTPPSELPEKLYAHRDNTISRHLHVHERLGDDVEVHAVYIRADLAPTHPKAGTVEALTDALKKIRCTPPKPFPDRGAHSERVFWEAVWAAYVQIQQIAGEALTRQPSDTRDGGE